MDKELILSEIRRTAQENGGKPLGTQRFFNATGIRKSDVERHWARWGDALAEAGFAPNELQAAYSDDFLLAQFVEFTRELGRVPVANELRLKARQDRTFPSRNTFDRLGTKRQLVQRVVEFCKVTPGCNDVLGILENWTPPAGRSAEDQETLAEAATSLGFVYLMKSGRFYKIGHTVSVGQRHRQLAIQLPERLALVHEIKTDDPLGIEAYWHNRFASRRQNGEWFVLTSDDVRAFKRRKFM